MDRGNRHGVKRRLRWKQPSTYQELAAQPSLQPLAEIQTTVKRLQANTRVQAFGQRLQCSPSQAARLRETLQIERNKKKHWTCKAWKLAVQKIRAQGWGARQHGGFRWQGRGNLDAQEELKSAEKAIDLPTGHGRESDEDISSVKAEGRSNSDDQSAVGDSGTVVHPAVLVCQRKLSGYDVLGIINSGSYGNVYKVKRKDTGELFAVKVMLKAKRTAQRTVSQGRELSIMKSLNRMHPHIMNLLGWRDTAFNFQLFMPLYSLNLRQYIQRGLVSIQNGRTICSQACSAVVYLHQKQIAHRDIKPQNMLVNCQPLAVVLSDFGSAREVLPNSPMSPRMTTLWYRAPEILVETTYGVSSDVWSLGITFVEVETGSAPFQHASEKGMLTHIYLTFTICSESVKSVVHVGKLTREPSPRPWGRRFGQRFKALIEAMLVVEPDQRISAEQAMRLSFFAVAQSLPGASSI